MKSFKKNIKNSRPKDLISGLWEYDVGNGTIKKAEEYLKKHPKVIDDLQLNDPAALLFLVGDKTRQILAADDMKSLTPAHHKKLLRKNDSFKSSPSLFVRKWSFAAAAASIIILLGILLISKTNLFRQEGPQDNIVDVNSSENLKKNGVYDNYKNTGATLVSREAIGQGKTNFKNLPNPENSIATNLVADGEKVIRYTMDNGTEVIFITGLN